MKKWQFWLGVLISVLFIWLALRGLRLDQFWQAVKTANYWWLLPGMAVYFVAVWARAWRWHYLLQPIKDIPTNEMFPITTIGYMGNNIYPARAGEVLRAVVLKRREGVSVSASLATIIVERIFDGVVMLGFVFVNLPELARLTSNSGFVGNIQQVAVIGTGVFLGALLVFLLAAMFPAPSNRLGTWLMEHLLPCACVSGWRPAGKQQRAQEDARPDHRDLLDISYKAGTARESRQFRQIDEYKAQHHHAVKDALDDDGSQGGRDGDALPALQHHRPQHFARSCRIDVVAHVPDRGDRKHLVGGNVLHGTQQVMPAPGAGPDGYKIHRHARQEPPVVRRFHGLPELVEAQSSQRKPDEEYAYENAQPNMPFLHANPF